MPSPTPKPNEFLRESNAIEGVYDDDSLKQAKLAWDYLLTEKKLTPGVVLKTHKILMLHQPLKPDEIGYFRTVPVWVGEKEKSHYSNLMALTEMWCLGANLAETWLEIREDHIDYENIHPFIDGNGRTGRMFMNWQRLKTGLDILVLKEKEKKDYYAWF